MPTKFLVLGGGIWGFFGGGGGWVADCIFMGAGDFLNEKSARNFSDGSSFMDVAQHVRAKMLVFFSPGFREPDNIRHD